MQTDHARIGHTADGRRAASAFRWLASLALTACGPAALAQNCYVQGAFGMDFGSVTASGRAAASSIKFNCEPDYGRGGTFYYQVCLYLSPGQWSAGQPTRRMSNYNGAFLNYDLFSDPAHTQLLGAPGSTPVDQFRVVVPPGSPRTTQAPVYGWVYPGQSVGAARVFQEQGIQGLLRYRFSSSGYPASTDDCSAGGSGGGSVTFSSSGVLATYDNACWIVATDLDFGSTAPPLRPVRAEGTIRVQCAPGTSWRVGLSDGQHRDGGSRRMAGAQGYVRYEIYRDSSFTEVWGDDESSQASGSTGPAGNTVLLTVYGEVPPQPDLGMGAYTDTIVATLYY
ncbi:MAG: spore coat U domain-containing protein [Achromobacter sp.]|uniref:Csu type fimbrial protein n=1 Tax=Achromobacter sp. TaxID=134375 RepID=UPI003D0812F6